MIQLNQLIKVKFILIFSFLLLACEGGDSKIKEVKLLPVKTGGEFQYVDRKGSIVINPQFSEASVFRDGLALVKTSGDNPKYGYITEDGKYEIMANYEEATVFNEGLAWVVREESAPSAIDTKEEIKFTLHNAKRVRNFSDGLAAFLEINEGERRWGFVNKKGEVVINPQFYNVGKFVDGKCPVSNSDRKWGYIDKEGKLIMNYQFDGAKPFSKSIAIVKFENDFGLIDKEGKYIVNPQFSEIDKDGDTYLVRKGDKYGWVDKTGDIKINPQFDRAFPFHSSDLAPVKSGGKYGYIDREGKIIINPQFDMALPFNGDMAMVGSSGKIGFVDKEGKYVVNPQFDSTSEDLTSYMIRGNTDYDSVESYSNN